MFLKTDMLSWRQVCWTTTVFITSDFKVCPRYEVQSSISPSHQRLTIAPKLHCNFLWDCPPRRPRNHAAQHSLITILNSLTSPNLPFPSCLLHRNSPPLQDSKFHSKNGGQEFTVYSRCQSNIICSNTDLRYLRLRFQSKTFFVLHSEFPPRPKCRPINSSLRTSKMPWFLFLVKEHKQTGSRHAAVGEGWDVWRLEE
jgi:hypothetical protein